MRHPVAAIDIGTNSFHMVIARGDPDGNIEIIDRERQSVRLGQGGGDFDIIQPDAQDRAVAVLRGFAQIARSHHALIHAVGTSAVREARNQSDFLRRVRRDCGIKINVIPGQEEARLIYLGILQALPVFDRRLLVIDIGGGSTEYLIGQRGTPEFIQSLKLGAIRTTERFFPSGLVTSGARDDCRAFLRSRLERLLEQMKEKNVQPWDVAVGSSGTVKTLLDLSRENSSAPENTIRKENLDRVVEMLCEAKSPQDRVRRFGLDEKRADIIIGGALILQESFRILRLSEMVYSPGALREGVLFEVLYRKKKREGLNEIRRKSVQFLAKKFLGSGPADDVPRIALLLLQAFHRAHLAHITDQDLLEYGAVLHNIGIAIGSSGHHKHGMYIIQNTDVLLGFSNREIAILAALARYHRKADPSRDHPEFTILSDEDRDRVKLFAGILRIAIGLSRAASGVIGGIAAEQTGHRHLRIRIHLTRNAFRSPPDVSFAVTSAEMRKELLEKVLGQKISMEVVS